MSPALKQHLALHCFSVLTLPRRQEKMEVWVINNIRSALEKGQLMSPVPEQKDLK